MKLNKYDFLIAFVVVAMLFIYNTANAVEIVKNGKSYTCKENKIACKPKIIYRTRYKVKTEVKTVVKKEVQNVTLKNRVSLLAGRGPLGNLKETYFVNRTQYQTENNLVLGLQYMRDFSEGTEVNWHGLIQVQSNKSVSLGVGLGF